MDILNSHPPWIDCHSPKSHLCHSWNHHSCNSPHRRRNRISVSFTEIATQLHQNQSNDVLIFIHMFKLSWTGITDYWKSEEFLKISNQNKNNRASKKGGALHTSGRKAHADVALELICAEPFGAISIVFISMAVQLF
ncbi:hypothetical protein TSUD_43130 [Trifolium subterraneum]|uniref:Uncharacterized protein n=1 Tax=Trifolium subterraneum TaxID=3900 RepID=A0A2Z6NL37_TRISU|nr:hypothetical protein TSUD_43130 [Trifolium subterraneum]